ncbi:MAG: hypothetical protein KAS72_14850 [Phycisphaerales bacterium]|nr:hypothetical protein [Phycisphaerales bacterium]
MYARNPGLLLTSLLLLVATCVGNVQAQTFTPVDQESFVRCFVYDLDKEESDVTFNLFTGTYTAALDGSIALQLGPTADAAHPGCLQVIVRHAWFIATDWYPDAADVLPYPFPLVMVLDPSIISGGWWNPLTGELYVDLYLTTPDGPLPVPMPLMMEGYGSEQVLVLAGDNGPIPDAGMSMSIVAHRAHCLREILFSTEVGFTSGMSGGFNPVSDGDLLSNRRCVVRRNFDLMQNMGVMPPVPDLGLDAVTNVSFRPILFSIEEPIFSETLGPISDGDLLADSGIIVRTNEQLIDAFQPLTNEDVGLDAVHVDTTADTVRGFLFSVEQDFYSALYDCPIKHGDLLAENGEIIRSNAQLLENFHPICDVEPCPDLGLDAVYIRPHGEIWFSVEDSFDDAMLGYIYDGDLLSDRGYIVRGNLQLLHVCSPLEDLANFGLDALDFGWCRPGCAWVDDVTDGATLTTP